MVTTTRELILFKGNNIRTAYREDGEPGACLADICAQIGIKNVSHLAHRLDQGGIFSNDTPTQSGIQSMLYVTESGLYEAVGGSRKPLAKELTRVIIKALPSLRQNGQDAQQIAELEARIAKLEQGGAHLLTSVPEISIRSQLNIIIRKFVYRQTSGYSYEDAWNELYFQYKYRYHKDLKAGARNRNCDVLEYAEATKQLPDLLALASHIFRRADDN